MSEGTDRDWQAGTWQGSRRRQLRRSLDTSPRQRLEGMVTLNATAQRLAASGRLNGSGERNPADASTIREDAANYGDGTSRRSVTLSGCCPVPLGSYLKALGILRLVAEQADRGARGHWSDEQFVLTSRLSEEDLQRFLRERYEPTPILAPWNGGSGFYPSDNKSGIDPLAAANAPRFSRLRSTIASLGETVRAFGLEKKPDGEVKTSLMAAIRAEADEDFLKWLDAAVLLSEDDPKYPPLLGTGGNDGRLDFTNNFQRLVEVFDPDSGEPRTGGENRLTAALFGSAAPGLSEKAIGQFMPGAAGGPNAGTGFEADSLVNPWDFILMLEGALVFAATATRRHTRYGEGQLSYPFTVRPTGAGTGAASMADEPDARAELWAPLWERSLSLGELRALLGEGRATVAGRAARDGLDFVRAVAGLGVERGVSAFQRYAFMQRSGKAYLATPLNRVPVRRNTGAELVDQLERNQFLGRFRSFARRGSNQAARLARVLEDRLFDLTDPAGGAEQNRPHRVQGVVEALGAIVHYLAVSDSAREACPRLPWLDGRWMLDGNDHSPEFRIAAALAGIGTGNLPMICHLLPVSADDPTRYDAGSRAVTWHQGSLTDNLVAVLRRRLLESQQREDLPDKPLDARPVAAASDVHAYLMEETDDARIARLLAGLALVRRPPAYLPGGSFDAPLPAAYRALKPLFASDDQLRRAGVLDGDGTLPLPARLPTLLAADRAREAWPVARRRMHASGMSTVFRELDTNAADGPRLLAALMLPVEDRLLRDLADRVRARDSTEESPKTDSTA